MKLNKAINYHLPRILILILVFNIGITPLLSDDSDDGSIKKFIEYQFNDLESLKNIRNSGRLMISDNSGTVSYELYQIRYLLLALVDIENEKLQLMKKTK